MKHLTKSHCTQLMKVVYQLAYNQKMNGTQLILSEKNKTKMKEAENLIRKAILILNED